MDDNKNFSRPDPENLPQTPNADNASEAADDIDDVIKIFHKDNSSALPQNILNGRLLLNIRRKKNKQY